MNKENFQKLCYESMTQDETKMRQGAKRSVGMSVCYLAGYFVSQMREP